MFGNRQSVFLLLVVPVVFMACVFVAPLAATFLASFMHGTQMPSLGNYAEIFGSSSHLAVLGVTVRIALTVTAVCVAIGYVIAYYIVMHLKSRVARRIAYLIVILPLFTSNVVRSFGFMIILGRKGVLNEWLIGMGLIDTPLRLLYNELAVVIGLTYISLPFVVLALIAALQSINPELLQASADLGAKPLSTFKNVVFPLTLPGLVGGSVLSFTLCVSAYVTPSVMFGGRGSVMAIDIYEQYMASMNFGLGAALAVSLALTALVVLFLQGVLVGRQTKWVNA